MEALSDHVADIQGHHSAALDSESLGRSDHWKNVITPVVTELLDRPKIVVRRFESTPMSVV